MTSRKHFGHSLSGQLEPQKNFYAKSSLKSEFDDLFIFKKSSPTPEFNLRRSSKGGLT